MTFQVFSHENPEKPILSMEQLTAKIVVSNFAHGTEFADWVQAVNDRIVALEKKSESS